MTLLDKDFTPSLSMESCRQAIALEANVVGNAIDTLKRYLPGLNEGFKEKVMNFTRGVNAPVVTISKNQKKAFEVLRSVDYMTLSDRAVYPHEGFKGQLKEFTPVLDKLLEDMGSVQTMVNDYRVFLSSIISDRNARKSIHDTFRKYRMKAKQRSEINDLVEQFYVKGSTQGKRKFSEVFARNSDAEGFIIQMGRIKHSLDAFQLKDLRNNVDQCVTLLDIFNQRTESGDVSDVSNEVATALSEMAWLIATEVEAVSLNHHRINIFVETANGITEMLAAINPNE